MQIIIYCYIIITELQQKGCVNKKKNQASSLVYYIFLGPILIFTPCTLKVGGDIPVNAYLTCAQFCVQYER